MTPAVRRLLREHDLSRRADPGHRWRWPDHPRRRPAGRRIDPDGLARTGRRRAVRTGLGPARRRHRPRRRPRCTLPAGAPDRVPGGRRRSPRPDDPDAQGHRRPDDPRPGRAARVRPDGGRRHEPGPVPRAQQARLPGPRGICPQLRAVRRQGLGRGAQAQPDLQRPLDRRRACLPSGGSTSASRSRSTTA